MRVKNIKVTTPYIDDKTKCIMCGILYFDEENFLGSKHLKTGEVHYAKGGVTINVLLN